MRFLTFTPSALFRVLFIIVFSTGIIACSAINNGLISGSSELSSLKPVGLQTSTGTQLVLLKWTPLSHTSVAGYRVFRSSTTSGNFQQLVEVGLLSQYVDRAVTNATPYFYRIQAIDNRGNTSQFSDVVSATPTADRVAPAAPQSVSANALHRSIKLTWQLNTEADLAGYVILRQADGIGSFTQIATASPVTQYTDTTAVVGTSYRYQVGAVDLSGNTSPYAQTEAVTAIVDNTAPAAPVFGDTLALNRSAQLSWVAATESDIASYQLYRQIGNAAATLVAQLGVVTTYRDNGLTNGTGYTYRLVAIDAAGNRSATSNPVTITPAVDTSAPGIPQQFTAVGRPTYVVLSWLSRSETDVVRYALYRQDPGSESARFIASVNQPEAVAAGTPFESAASARLLSYRDLGRQSAARYTYFVTAIDQSGNEGQRATVVVTAEIDLTAPTPPTLRSLYPAGTGTAVDPFLTDAGAVTLIWSASPEADVNTYEIHRGTTADFVANSGSKVASLAASVLRFTQTGLTNATTYFYRIVAVDDELNQSVASAAVAYQPRADITPPPSPQNVQTSGSDNQVLVTWDLPTDPNIIAIQIFYRTTSRTEDFQLLVTLAPNQSRYLHSNLVQNLVYFYDVRFVSRTGALSTSQQAVAGVPVHDTFPPDPPVQIGGTALSGKIGLYIQESRSLDVRYYQLYRQSSPSGTRTLIHTWNLSDRQANGFYYYEDTVTPDTPYYYTAVAVDYANLTGSTAQTTFSALPDRDPPPKVLGANIIAGSKSAFVSWSEITGVPDLAGYTLLRGTDPLALTAVQTLGVVLQVTDTGLTNGTRYYYAIQARDTLGNLGPRSDVVSTIPTSNLLPPSNLSIVELDSQIRLAWQAPSGSGVSGYALYRSLITGGPYTKVTDIGLILTYTDTTVINDTTYFYTMRSTNSTDESANSAEISGTPHPDRTAPPIPTGLTAQVGAVSNGVRLTWTAVSASDLAGYVVEAANNPGGPYTVLSNQIGVTTNYLATNLNNGQRTYFVVKSRDLSGNISNASAEISAIPVADVEGPETPVASTLTVGNQRIRLTWNRISNVFNDFKEYVIFRSLVPGGPYNEIEQVETIDTLTYTDTDGILGLTNGTPYYYVIRSRDTTNNLSNASTELNGTPRQLAAPTNVRSTVGHRKVTVIWDALVDPNVANYSFFMSTDALGPFTRQQTTGGNVNSAIVSNLVNATPYFFYVTANDPLGQSSPESLHITATPVIDTTPPRAPSGLTGIASGSDVNLEWNAPSVADYTEYVIIRRVQGSNVTENVATLNANVNESHISYLDTSPAPSIAYLYVVKSVDEAGNVSPSSNELAITPQNAAFQRTTIQTRGGKMTVGNIYVSWYAVNPTERNAVPQPDYDQTRYTGQSFSPQAIRTAQVHFDGRTMVRITLSAPTAGWVGIAYKKPDGDMSLRNCNIIVGFANGNTAQVLDMFGTTSTTRVADTSLGGQNNASLFEGAQVGNRTSITFFIPLTKSDPYDQHFLDDSITEFPSGATTVFLLSGTTDSFTTAPTVTIPLENFSF